MRHLEFKLDIAEHLLRRRSTRDAQVGPTSDNIDLQCF